MHSLLSEIIAGRKGRRKQKSCEYFCPKFASFDSRNSLIQLNLQYLISVTLNSIFLGKFVTS